MPRSYFPHEHGYINLMEDRICFTRSGNWQEAEATTERTGRGSALHAGRIAIGVLLIGTAGVVLGIGEASHLSEGLSIPLAIGLVGFGFYKMYGLLRRDFGPSFCVPLSKIRSIDHTPNGFTIHFLNGAMKEDSIAITAGEDASTAVAQALAGSRGPGA